MLIPVVYPADDPARRVEIAPGTIAAMDRDIALAAVGMEPPVWLRFLNLHTGVAVAAYRLT